MKNIILPKKLRNTLNLCILPTKSESSRQILFQPPIFLLKTPERVLLGGIGQDIHVKSRSILTAGNKRLAWRNLAPPRAQLHVWLVLLWRLNTKDRLFRLETPGVGDNLCTFCKDESEHLFFSCKVSSKLCYFSCDCWNMSICLPKGPEACFLSWLGAPFKRFDKKIWIFMFYVVLWTIWDIRNKIIFQDLTPNWEFEKRRLLWPLGTWVRGWCSRFPFSTTQMAENLNDVRG